MGFVAQIILILIGNAVGLLVGTVLGLFLPYLACLSIDTLTGSESRQIGWLVLFATIPGGAIFGTLPGGMWIVNRPRLFFLTFFPLFLLFVSAQFAFRVR